jgi:uncharacterized membrane protein HdeD (DUF308 family)
MSIDKKYLLCAFGYAVLGICLGIYMSASGDHVQRPTHAHILLPGFVISFIYAVIHKLWLTPSATKLANLQFILHQAGLITIVIGLFMLFSNAAPESTLGPILGIASVTVLVGVLLMIYMVIKSTPAKA